MPKITEEVIGEWVGKVITIRVMKDGGIEADKKVMADCLGPFAVHNAYEKTGKTSLSHIPTKLKFSNRWSRADAKAIAELLMQICPDAFKSSDQETVEKKTPKNIKAWLKLCHREGRMVSP